MPSLKYPIEIAYCTVSLMKDLVLKETMALSVVGEVNTKFGAIT